MRFIRRSFERLVHLCFACVPGCGQMYQGYMKRGISLTVIFCALVFIAVFLEIGALGVLAIPLWLYSFFDSYNLRRQAREGLTPEDDYLFGLSDMDSRRLSRILSRRGSLIGWVLVVVGLYNVYQIFARRIFGALREYFPFFDWVYGLLVWDMPRIMGTVLVTALGIWFIRGPKPPRQEEVTAYTPPKTPEELPKMKSTPWTEAEAKFHEEPEPQAPVISESPEPAPITLIWKSEFNVEQETPEQPKA